MGDLVILIECPNGQTTILHQQGGGGTQIGIPNPADNVDCDDASTLGEPFTYCFTNEATETWVEWVANSNFGGTIPAGDYEPIEPLSNLIGCPANGVWTLTVIDNWAADDGTLFSFGLNLDPHFTPRSKLLSLKLVTMSTLLFGQLLRKDRLNYLPMETLLTYCLQRREHSTTLIL